MLSCLITPSSTSLPGYKQGVHSCSFLVSTEGLSHGGQRACICVPTTQSICTHSCLCMLTQKRDCTSIKFSVFTHAAKLQTIFHLQNTQWHHQMSHPFHLLLLLSVTAASALPNGFSNAGTRFLSRLDRHFPLCLEMRIRP